MEGRIQVGVIPSHRASSSLVYQHLFYEQMYLYCGAEHPLFQRDGDSVTVEDVHATKYAGLGYHSPNMELSSELGWARDATVFDQEAIIHCLRSGRYVGYLPDHYAKPFVQQGLIKPLAQQRFHYRCDFVAMHRVSPKPSRVVETFWQCLQEAHQDIA